MFTDKKPAVTRGWDYRDSPPARSVIEVNKKSVQKTGEKQGKEPEGSDQFLILNS